MRVCCWVALLLLVLVIACQSDRGQSRVPLSTPPSTPSRSDVGTTIPAATAAVMQRSSLPSAQPQVPDESTAVMSTAGGMLSSTPVAEATEQPHRTEGVTAPAILASAHTSFPAAPDRDLVELARSLRLKTKEPIERIVGPPTGQLALGRIDEFQLISLNPVRAYSREFVLRHISPNAYWYVQAGLSVTDEDIQRAASAFENDVYPKTVGLWGTEWKPGVDEDPRMTILNGRLQGGAAGYFSSADEYPREVHPHSNQREMLYMNAEYLRVGSSLYLAVLTHELFHAVAWAADPSEDTWVSEGMAELNTILLGRYPGPPYSEVPSPTPSLVNWPLEPLSGANYAYSLLFFQYLSERVDMPHDLIRLAEHQSNGVVGVDAYLRSLERGLTFRQMFSDWLVANLLDESGSNAYGYDDIAVGVYPLQALGQGGIRKAALQQYSAEYVELTRPQEAHVVRFQGVSETPLIGINVDENGCWWSNSGDSISSTLTRRVDLSQVESALLSYRIWYDIEEGWDYGYVEVSSDDESTWDVLPASGTTTYDPAGNSYGPGYTGSTGGWLTAEADLSPYTGKEVDVRFHYVTDDSVNGSGICVDDISVPELDLEHSQGGGGWRGDGFLATSNRVVQDYVVQVVEIGNRPLVSMMALDKSNKGEFYLNASSEREGVVVVIAAMAPKTRESAGYTLTVEAAPTS